MSQHKLQLGDETVERERAELENGTEVFLRQERQESPSGGEGG